MTRRTKQLAPRAPLRLVWWLVAILLASAALFAQERWSHWHQVRGTVTVAGASHDYSFPQVWELTPGAGFPPGARIKLRLEGEMPELDGAVLWRPFPSDDPFMASPFEQVRRRVTKRGEGTRIWTELVAILPPRPGGERIEYYATLNVAGQEIRVPAGEKTVVLQYETPIPEELSYALFAALVLSLVIGTRAAISAICEPETVRRYAWATLFLLTAGTLTLGVVVSYQEIGEYWNGFPMGNDAIATATLVVWLAWVIACIALGRSTTNLSRIGRTLVVVAACLLIALAAAGDAIDEVKGNDLPKKESQPGGLTGQFRM